MAEQGGGAAKDLQVVPYYGSHSLTAANNIAGGKFKAMPADHILTEIPRLQLCCLDLSKLDNRPEQLVLVADNPDGFVVGREDGLSGQLKSNGISRRHARFTANQGQWMVEDLDSTNGVFVNGERITTMSLRDGDEVKLGPIRFRASVIAPEADAEADGTMMVRAPMVDSEHTMMADSREASEAVLKAVRQADADQTQTIQMPQRAASPADAQPGRRGGAMRMAVLAAVAVAAAVGGGVYYFQQSAESGSIEAAVHSTGQTTRRLVDTVRERAAADLVSGDYKADLQVLAPKLAEMQGLAETYRGAPMLVGAAGRLHFLEFERRFVPLMHGGRLAEAEDLVAGSRASLQRLEGLMPAGVRDAETEEIRTARDLVEFAGILLRFRRFSLDFPLGRDQRPAPAQVQAMLDLKGDFARYRRQYNKTLSVHYLVFRAMVNEIEERDTFLVNQWKDLQDGKAG